MEVITVGIGVLTLVAVWAIDKLLSLWGDVELPTSEEVIFNDFDKKKIIASRTLITQCFGKNIVETFKYASNLERIKMTEDFAKRLATEYGLNDIDIDVVVDRHKLGYYNHEMKKAVFNIELIVNSEHSENFNFCVRETIDTIVHELRHAVQHHAIDNPGFWNIDVNTLNSWKYNTRHGNYIRPEVDLEGYSNQPIEKDAFHFSSEVVKGLC